MVSKRQEVAANPSALLVSLPWTTLAEPSLGLAILRAVLDEKGIPCRILHLNIFLLEHIRADTYFSIAYVFSLNDFLFSGVLDPAISPKQERWLRLKTQELLGFGLIDARQYEGVDGVVQQLLRLRQEVIPNWLARWADEIASSDATLVGLTCMFDQTIASVALAHLLKQRAPDKLVVLGGYAVRSPTGEAVLRSFPCVDAICTGEGESAIEPLVRASIGELSIADVPNLLYRTPMGGVAHTSAAPLVDMNSIPVPNFDDFFADLKMLSDLHRVEITADRLPIENSRGCWWGQKKHCVFCGIHDDDMAYRSRKGSQVLEVLDRLAARYGFMKFRFSDYILPHKYYDTLLPELVGRRGRYRISSEMKSNVNADRFALLAAAGFDEVQPGIESFSSGVLRKMDKGVSAVQNVYTLLLGKRHGIAIRYNILYGFPDDDEREYETMVKALPRLLHLDPPTSRLEVQVTRYAPLQTTPQRFGIPRATYEPSYDLIFSSSFLECSNFDLDDFCYYFDRPFENSPRLNNLYAEIDHIVDGWVTEKQRREVYLWYEERAEAIEISDSRSEPPVVTHLNTAEAKIYLALSEPITIEKLRQRCAGAVNEEIEAVLERLDELGLIFREADLIIGLALPRKPITPTESRGAIESSGAGRRQVIRTISE